MASKNLSSPMVINKNYYETTQLISKNNSLNSRAKEISPKVVAIWYVLYYPDNSKFDR